jgi:hypothetical protein
MAESDTILQLGIEAAREGNREEARNLFGLLTRQEPNNVQAWLWLAGVADGPDERRAALERVAELDPTNDMAIKGLQAMGATPPARRSEAATLPEAAATPSAPARPMTDEERYAAELDSAFDDYDALPKAPARPVSDLLDDDETISGVAARSSSASSARDRVAARRARSTSVLDDDDDLIPARNGPSTFFWVILGVIGLVIVAFLVFKLLNPGGQQIANNGPGGGVITPTLDLTLVTPISGIGLDETTVPTETTELTATLVPIGTVPPAGATAIAPPPAGGDLSGANPAPVAAGTQLEANGWSFSFPDICGVSCATVYGKQIGNNTAQGSYVVVLVAVANNTGTDQPLPASYFVLKDAQGQIHEPLPPVSSAYIQPGINADRSMEDAIPANGGLTTVPLIFDVPSGATNLTLFARAKTDQGWLVLNSVP